MANLLPQKDKEDVNHAYKLRRLVIAGILLTVLVLVAITMLIPLYVASSNNYGTTRTSLDQLAQNLEETNLTEAKAAIEETNTKLAMLVPIDATNTNAHTLFIETIAHANSAISLTGFFYEIKNDVSQLTISGTADTRDALAQFAESLRADPQFENVELPISNLVKEQDINFSLSMQVASTTQP